MSRFVKVIVFCNFGIIIILFELYTNLRQNFHAQKAPK
jgi:hypothetical protein